VSYWWQIIYWGELEADQLFCSGGDPGGDALFSPLEPAFYLHHAQIDRLYFIWQNLDWDNRQVSSRMQLIIGRPIPS
jgi:tyrosinase